MWAAPPLAWVYFCRVAALLSKSRGIPFYDKPARKTATKASLASCSYGVVSEYLNRFERRL
jgi:hypothetical protein